MKVINTLPKVSIVTTVYNAVATIEDTIRSVERQTYPNIEYIVVDGGSTDGTQEIIARHWDRIDKFISEPDKGIADGFNKGISMASGDWIGLINADDWYADDAIETMVRHVTNDDYVYCGNVMLLGPNGYSHVKKSKVGWLNLGMYVMHPTCFVRPVVYRQVGTYDLSLPVAMDYDMFLRIKRRGFPIKYADELVTYMRTGGNSSDPGKAMDDELVVMRRHLAPLDYATSITFNYLNRLRWRLFYKDPFGAVLK